VEEGASVNAIATTTTTTPIAATLAVGIASSCQLLSEMAIGFIQAALSYSIVKMAK